MITDGVVVCICGDGTTTDGGAADRGTEVIGPGGRLGGVIRAWGGGLVIGRGATVCGPRGSTGGVAWTEGAGRMSVGGVVVCMPRGWIAGGGVVLHAATGPPDGGAITDGDVIGRGTAVIGPGARLGGVIRAWGGGLVIGRGATVCGPRGSTGGVIGRGTAVIGPGAKLGGVILTGGGGAGAGGGDLLVFDCDCASAGESAKPAPRANAVRTAIGIHLSRTASSSTILVRHAIALGEYH